ncbi:MAG: 4Fe-4S dicluster domain-containing protein [Myxococcota bacterium]|nr:4Fe-4S dicluster domain-containing protein [Myxococcota bacterium]
MASGKTIIDDTECKGCELCIAFCPRHRIGLGTTINEKGYIPAKLISNSDVKNCTGCALCAVVCPELAITVFRGKGTDPEAPND